MDSFLENQSKKDMAWEERQPQPVFDAVEGPAYYFKKGVWCKDVMQILISDMVGYEANCIGNAFGYMWRWKGKNGVEDLKKARRELDMLIEYVEKEETKK